MVLNEERKAEAVRAVAGSVTFHRSDVLKSLLEYLHAQEVLGRAHEVTESEIAMKVMGRGASFSPESDSSVRTRFLALRKKLDEYYAGEGREASVRLDVPRGTYTLRFVPNVAPVVAEPEAPVVPASAPPLAADPFGWKAFAAGFALAAAIAAIGVFWMVKKDSGVDRLMAQAWGPMLEKGTSVTIAIGTPASFFVRDFGDAEPPAGDPRYRLPFTRDKEFEDWYRVTRNLPLGKTALLHPNAHSPLWGDSAAASVISRMLGEHGVAVEIVPSARVHPVALRERNAVIIGRPEYTDAAKAFLPEDALAVEYSVADRSVGIHNRAPRQGEPAWWFPSDGLRHNYGLITVVRAADGPVHKKTVLLAGINSDGAEAGARFLTSLDKLGDLDKRFRALGLSQWPGSFQVVVRTESMDTYSLQTRFEFLRIWK